MAKEYYWATRGAARLSEEAACRRRGILHLMCELKPMFAVGMAHGVRNTEEEEECGPATDCRQCSHCEPRVPAEDFEYLKAAGVGLPGRPEEYFNCQLSRAPMREAAGNCLQFDH